jgi:hypothetical protein
MDDPNLAALGAAARRYASVDSRYLELLHANVRRLEPPLQSAFLRELIADSKLVSDHDLAAMLGEFSGWRERIVAAWMAGIDGRSQHRQRIGELLIESRQTFAGQGYCFALTCFAAPADARILCDYLDRYLRRPDLVYDQDWAIGALLDIDRRLGTDDAERFTTPGGLWQQWARDKSPGHLEAQRSRAAGLRALVEAARHAGADGQAVNLPAGWVPIPDSECAAFEAELATEVAADLKPRHPLANRRLKAVAHCNQRDHVLFKITENPIRWALVHLSWSGQPEADIRPHRQLFASTETAAAGLQEHLRQG